jgi:hypothetical protein
VPVVRIVKNHDAGVQIMYILIAKKILQRNTRRDQDANCLILKAR